MPYRFEFATFLVYATKRADENSRRSVKIAAQFKNAAPQVLERLAFTLEKNRDFFSEIFTESTLLVPAPRSHVTKEGYLWPTLEICKTLVENGFANNYRELIKRTTAVPKSSTARPEDRPDWKKHYNSIEIDQLIAEEEQLLIVDDVFTKGNTTVGCAIKLSEAYPDKTIKIFSVMRTRGFIEELPNIINPKINSLQVNEYDRIILPD